MYYSKKKSNKSEGEFERRLFCPCKNANLKCCENCKYGTKKADCKNKGVVVVVNRNPSAFARCQGEQANAEREIKVSRKFCDTKLCSSHQSLVTMS